MIGADDYDDLWHATIERNRVYDHSFDEGLSLDLAVVLMTSTSPDRPQVSPERVLLKLREWYGADLERISVLAVMRHFKVDDAAKPDVEERRSVAIRCIARALWDIHRQAGCADASECSLHSLGSLWAHGWLEPPGDDATRVIEALKVLVAQHPLRAWALQLVRQAANWVDEHWMTAADAEELLETAVDAGLHEHLPNTASLGESWGRLVLSAPTELQPKLALIGNKIIAAGGTHVIDAQLGLLRRGS